MQLKVAKMLNKVMIGMVGVILALGVLMYMLATNYPGGRVYFIVGFVAISLILLAAFRWLESRWEKRVVTTMAQAGNIALAHIKQSKRLVAMRDSGFKKYWLYEFEADIFDKTHKRTPKTFFEKMSEQTDNIPNGWVYITYDEEKPSQIYIIPNIMISHIPTLEPIIRKYESNKKLDIKYLDVYYNNGMVIRTYREAVKEASKETAGQTT